MVLLVANCLIYCAKSVHGITGVNCFVANPKEFSERAAEQMAQGDNGKSLT